MSHIEVVSAAIEEMAGRLGGIAPGTGEFHGQVATHATAAADTAAHEAMTGLMARWATALPQFAEAGDACRPRCTAPRAPTPSPMRPSPRRRTRASAGREHPGGSGRLGADGRS